MTTVVKLHDGSVEITSEQLKLYNKDFHLSQDETIKPISKKVFNKFVIFANHYLNLDAVSKKQYEELETLYGSKLKNTQQIIKQWCDEFCKDLTIDELLEFINYAKLSGNKIIETISVIPIANDMWNLDPDQFRLKYNLKSDFTQDDINQLASEEQIWQSISDASDPFSAQ